MADIEISREGRVQIIRFNRAAKKNAITSAMYRTMADALTNGDDDAEIGANLFLGQPEVFTSGNDIMEFMAVAMGGEHKTDVQDFLKALATTKKPMLAALDGLAVGVGCTMLMHCDFVCASPRAWVQTPFVALGLVPEASSSLLAPRIMGRQRAFELLAMGEKFSAEKAERAGLINAVIETDNLEIFAKGKAQQIAEQPPEALAIARRLVRSDTQEILERMAEEGALFAERLKSDEARQAFMQFMQKAG